ncbi:hypothetical protein ACQPZQ_02385 [Pseudonocardia sp. CA-142604]|uniref:hypothetical protein n=1 Tax=Pseudonocardia sp. CA-142604 TaxID=3240024 RepID=UPI003D8A14F1
MDDLRPDRTAITTVTALGSLLGHHGGDYLVQPDWCARHKQQRTRTGRTALAVHAATYALTQAVTKSVFYQVAGARVPVIAQLAGAVAEGVLHAVIDDGSLLARFADMTGKRGFHDRAAGGVNGRMLLDQAAHHQLQIPAGTAVTVAVTLAVTARRARNNRRGVR